MLFLLVSFLFITPKQFFKDFFISCFRASYKGMRFIWLMDMSVGGFLKISWRLGMFIVWIRKIRRSLFLKWNLTFQNFSRKKYISMISFLAFIITINLCYRRLNNPVYTSYDLLKCCWNMIEGVNSWRAIVKD